MLTTDNELLGKYLVKNDARAFEELVQRHSGLVMGVCRNMLFHRQDAEDAFQATFLILARKAKKLTNHGSISGWLYQVAIRNCMQIRRRKRKTRETEMVSEPIVGNNEPWQSITNAEESDLIYKEIHRLPKRYREVIVLCHLQGHSRSDAAELLGWTDAAVKAALARGRNLLRQRLVRSGLMTGALLVVLRNATTSAAEAVTPSLVTSTLEHCQGLIPKSTPGLPGTTPQFVRALANHGALNMQATTFTKALVMGSALLLAVSLPLAVLANFSTDSPINIITVDPNDSASNQDESQSQSQLVAIEPNDEGNKSVKQGGKNEELNTQSTSAGDINTPDIESTLSVFHLKHHDANTAFETVTELLPLISSDTDAAKLFPTKLAVDVRKNSLLVTGDKKTVDLVIKLVALVDQPMPNAALANEDKKKVAADTDEELNEQKSKAAFHLSYSKAKATGGILKKLITFDDGKAGSPKLIINTYTNTLHIEGTKKTLELVNMLVALIDRPTPNGALADKASTEQRDALEPKQVNVYRLSNRRAKDVRDTLQQLLATASSPVGNCVVRAEESSNSLIVTADSDSMNTVETLVRYIDGIHSMTQAAEKKPTSIPETKDYSIENSLEYWRLIKQARQAKIESLDAKLNRRKTGDNSRSDIMDTTAELYQVRAQIVEADLHLKRITSETRQRQAQNKQQALLPALGGEKRILREPESNPPQ